MTDIPADLRANASSPSTTSSKSKRTDEHGRAYAGSQMHLQVWVNRRQSRISTAVLQALDAPESDVVVEWISPLEGDGFREYKDGAFLKSVGLERRRKELRAFWPSGGPVWDGLARLKHSTREDVVVLIEAKSYPDEVRGNGCQASSASRRKIETALDATARWLRMERPPSWMGALYQSANRMAHVYFLRERLGVEASMINICFVGDPRMPTTEEAWKKEKDDFRRDLGIEAVPTPWLIDVYLPAASRAELVPHIEFRES